MAMVKSAGNTGLKMSVNREELGGKPVESGVYEARFNSELTTSSTKKPMIKATYTLSGKMPSGKNALGRKIIDNIVLQQEVLWKLNQPYHAATGEDLPEGDFTVDELYALFKDVTENKRFSIEVTTEPFTDKEGKQRENNRIKKIL